MRRSIPLTIPVLLLLASSAMSAPPANGAKLHGEGKGDPPRENTDNGLPPPDGLRDVGDLLAALTPRIAKGWELSGVDYGRTFPPERTAGQGFQIVIYETQAPVAAGKRAPWVDVHIWIMGPPFNAKGPFLLDERPVEEIARWRDRRVFLYGGKERWPRRRDDVMAALKAADKPAAGPTAIQQRFQALAKFVTALEPRVAKRGREHFAGTARRVLRKNTPDPFSFSRRKCLDAGCDDYVSKPIDRMTLEQTVRKHVAAPQRQQQTSAAPQQSHSD